jgi:hypothetical protein
MKGRLRTMLIGLAFAIIAALGLMAFVRLAPTDAATWHTDPALAAPAGEATPAVLWPPGTDAVIPQGGGAFARILMPGGAPVEALSRLDTVALASPRTIRLAGSADEGRITWETRSALWGFPDYTTAEATATPEGTRIDIVARQRFGKSDLGVNAARLATWLAAL